ncbi:peptidase inhibitor family I36 protein [Streptomyces sp. NPDC059556]|uniref:peptidase inhibitor family I36 protein n=1 Tax=Streptomyces sp. NPDC059556 TaxID=3346863 RepID=UPI0036B12351
MRHSALRRLATVATTLGLTTAGLLGAGLSPAQAATSDCPSGYFCAWKTGNATGTMYKTTTGTLTLGTWGGTFRSVVNRTARWACLFGGKDHNANSGLMMLSPGSRETGLTNGFGSSLRLAGTEDGCSQPSFPTWRSADVFGQPEFSNLNSDWHSDRLVRNNAGQLWFLPGNGSGELIGTGGWSAFNAFVRHGDFSRDGVEDVIAREASTGKLWLYPGRVTDSGAAALGARKLIGTGGWNVMGQLVGAGDLNGDTRSDLVAVEKASGKLWLYPGTATGTLGTRTLLGTGGWNGMNALTGVGRMDSDDYPDLIAREASTGKLWFYPGKAGAYGSRVLIGSGWNSMASLLAVADYTGDGYNDMAAITGPGTSTTTCPSGDGCLIVYPGTGTGKLGPASRKADDWWGLTGAF